MYRAMRYQAVIFVVIGFFVSASYSSSTSRESEKYLCNNECDVSRERCDCKSGCEAAKNCCSDYQEKCLNRPAWVTEDCTAAAEMMCPDGFDIPPLLLFSIDGFKAEYLYRNLTPNIHKLASCGVHAPYMRSAYPTKTFPNHYTIATGLYPESHGIVDNTIYDHDHQEEFRLGREESFHPFWWGGEPIWVTTSNQGLKSATYFWPGSDVNITRYPDYYYKYDGSVDNEERIYQALDWLDLPKEDRPTFITLYMDIVDHAGHNVGPDGQETNDALEEADRIIGMLMNGLKLRNLDNCLNIIMLADHGMAEISCERKSSVEDYGVNLDNVYFRGGAFARIGKSDNPSLWPEFDARQTHNELRCQHNKTHWESYLKYEYFPKRYHYAFNDRIEDVALVMDDKWLVEGRKGSYSSCDGGTHGFDNEFASMHALFAAHGPGFLRSFNTTTPFENIEVYNLMTDLMNLTPAPNNGTPGALYNVMSSPKELTDDKPGEQPTECSYKPTGSENFGCSPCAGLSEQDANQRILEISAEEVTKLQDKHMLYGTPSIYPAGKAELMDKVSFCMLTQQDYVTAYNRVRKMPYFVSYSLDQKLRDLEPLVACSRHDVRVSAEATAPCLSYGNTASLSFAQLYPSELSFAQAKHDAAITSNNVPMYEYAQTVWNYMSRELSDWASNYGGINVVAGPAFDYNYDGLPDTDQTLLENGTFLENDPSVPIPTHFFLVVTRCSNVGEDIAQCTSSPNELEVLSFIIPNYRIQPCGSSEMDDFVWIPKTLQEHVARIKDVELLTGISFLSTWTKLSSTSNDKTAAIRAKLWLPQFTGKWLDDFINRDPDSPTMTTNSSPTSALLPDSSPTSALPAETTSAAALPKLNGVFCGFSLVLAMAYATRNLIGGS